MTGAGIPGLRDAILTAVAPAGAFEEETGFITSVRHEQLLRESAEYLEKAKNVLDAAGIQIPFPHLQLFVEDTPALRQSEPRFPSKAACSPSNAPCWWMSIRKAN